MAEEIVRELVNGEWVTKVGSSGGGGGLPDPSGEPDGEVLTVASGAAVWAAGGGSLPEGWTQDESLVVSSNGNGLQVGSLEASDLAAPTEGTLSINTAGGDVGTGGGDVDTGGGDVDLDGGSLVGVGGIVVPNSPLLLETDIDLGQYNLTNFGTLVPHTVPTVAVDLAAIHAALVTLGLIQAP